MYERELKKFTKHAYAIIILLVIFILLAVWFFGRGYLAIQVSPSEATVLVDNEPVSLNHYGLGKKYFKPGNHLLKIEADGYVSLAETIYLKRGLTTHITADLKKMPEQYLLDSTGKFLGKGKDNEFFYLGDSGRTIYKAIIKKGDDDKLAIEKQAITNQKLSGIDDIVWSPNKDLALFKTGNEVSIFDFHKYDFVNQTLLPWGKDIGDIAWSPDNSKIAYYHAPATGERSLIFTNLDNSQPTRILDMKDENLTIENPLLRWSADSEWLLIIPRNKNYRTNQIYLFDAYSKVIKPLTDTGSQIDAKFSPDGNNILYTTYSIDQQTNIPYLVSIMNKDGSDQKSLNLRVDLGKIDWIKGTSKTVTSLWNGNHGSESIISLDLVSLQRASRFINLGLDQKVSALNVSDDGKTVVYTTDKGIFASALVE